MSANGPLEPMPPVPLTFPEHGSRKGNGYASSDYVNKQSASSAAVQSRSQSVISSVGTGTDGFSLARVWELPEPEPRTYLLGGLIPKGAITLLYADGGMYKSFIVLYICILLLVGQPLTLAGRSLQKCKSVLYLDAELDLEEFTRRAFRLARGLGLERPPEGLHYFQLPGPLSHEGVQTKVRQVALSCGAEVSVLDSLTIASYGSDPTSAPDVTGVMKFLLQTLTTAICIDHISKPPPIAKGINLSQFRPFGSVFKGNLARSVIQVIKAEGGGVMLRQTKHNFGALADPLYLAVEFLSDGDCVKVEPITKATEGLLSGLEDHVPARERTWLELARYEDGSTPDFLASELQITVKTVKNHLSDLRKDRRVEPIGDGRWLVCNEGGRGIT